MSYSFRIEAPSKDKAKAAVARELDLVVGKQPVHAHDRAAAQAAADTFIDLLPDDDQADVAVSMGGSVNGDLRAQAVSVYVAYVPRDQTLGTR